MGSKKKINKNFTFPKGSRIQAKCYIGYSSSSSLLRQGGSDERLVKREDFTFKLPTQCKVAPVDRSNSALHSEANIVFGVNVGRKRGEIIHDFNYLLSTVPWVLSHKCNDCLFDGKRYFALTSFTTRPLTLPILGHSCYCCVLLITKTKSSEFLVAL